MINAHLGDMSYQNKHDEMTALGFFYKTFFVEGALAVLSAGAPVDMHGTRDLYQDRGRCIFFSMSVAERELMNVMSPQKLAKRPPKAGV